MGKYQVSECIGRGGMAEVFLARQEGIGGFEKLVALKRIYPHLVCDANFIELFLAEARIAAPLQYPKIVQILDIENDDEGVFIVMEYLAGESILQILKMLSDREEVIPPEIICRIGSDVATGLHLAHTASDSNGNARPVVHRDMTPSNVLISFSGEVKVLDFGVAEAAECHVTTDRGVLKGKTPHSSPEQVDLRADVFQLE
ncbi:MAG: serine/threonine protein kinase [Myxococcales bacterium]|nr:serine/threonine protein kinase [Myxococcales bacterium]